MSTPIETNTEELQEVLQQVYNLPSRSGGSASYDLIIPIDVPAYHGSGTLMVEHLGEIDWTAVSTTGEKLQNGENVKVLIKGNYSLDSGDGFPANIFPTSVLITKNGVLCVYCWLPDWYGQRGSVKIEFSATQSIVTITANRIETAAFS